MKNKIISLLISLKDDLNALQDNYYIIGTSGLHLLGKPAGETGDIDIVMSERDAELLKNRWKPYREETPVTKEDDLFISNFARYNFGAMDIEIMANLQIKHKGVFDFLEIHDYIEVTLDSDFMVKVPTVDEFKRILLLFGREKDFQKLAYLGEKNLHIVKD